MIAAHKLGRRARLMEIDPPYVDVICRRFTGYTGKPAILEATGQTFEAAAAERGREKKAPPIRSGGAGGECGVKRYAGTR